MGVEKKRGSVGLGVVMTMGRGLEVDAARGEEDEETMRAREGSAG